MEKLKQWFASLSPNQKRKLIGIGAVGLILLVILIAVLATDDGEKVRPASRGRKKVETSILTGKDPNKVGLDQLLASRKRDEAELEDIKRQLQSLKNQMGVGGKDAAGSKQLPFPYNQAQGDQVALPGEKPQSVTLPNGAGSVSAPGVTPMTAPDKAVADALGTAVPPPQGKGGRGQGQGQGQRSTELPPPNIPGMPQAPGGGPAGPNDPFSDGPVTPVVAPPPPPPPAPPPKPTLRILQPRSDSRTPAQETTQSSNSIYVPTSTNTARVGNGRSANRDPEFYLPMGSIMSGTLLTGVDAPASGANARKDPFPTLLRIKHEAILPNAGILDLRDCFLVASSYSDLSSERVYMRAEGLSCQRGDGAIIEATIDAYASAADGKAGIPGRVIEKTGQLIARSLAAGFLGGVADAFKPQKSQAVSVNPTGATSAFQFPDPSFVVGTGVLSGASDAATRIGGIYEELAKQIVPVIEINAGIPVDFIMTRGVTLRFKRVGEVTGAQPGRVTAGGQAGRPEPGSTSVTAGRGGQLSITPGSSTSTPPPMPSGGPSTFVGGRR